MDSQRNILLIALLAVTFLLYQKWEAFTNPVAPAVEAASVAKSGTSEFPDSSLATDGVSTADPQQGQLIHVKSDVLELTINTDGGDIVESQLLKYTKSLDSNQPMELLNESKGEDFVAQSRLQGPQGADSVTKTAVYSVDGTDFVMAEGQDQLVVPMTYSKNGITYQKRFILDRDSYAVKVEYVVSNNTDKEAAVQLFTQLRRTATDTGGSLTMPTYRGGAFSSQDDNYKKYSFDDMEDRNLDIRTDRGWVAMIQHYFTTAWIPGKDMTGEKVIYSRFRDDKGYLGMEMPVTTIAPDSKATLDATLWVGPKLQNQMSATAKYLDLTADYGWLWFLAKPLYWLLNLIQSVVGNWGVAIIVLTIIVRGAMYKLTKAQYTSMAKMRMLQPKLQEMRERFGDDRQRMSQAMMELYKKEKVNPLGGCLPILLQMPIFIALYWTLMESVELRHAPFFGWIHDLSAQDPYYILPILMGISMFIIQKMSPSTITDPMQQKIMTFMPVIFTGFFLFFPSGLVLYWLMSNIMTLTQQTIIYRQLEKQGLHTR
ncbi:Membrane protein insertase YidC [Vibrio stylophorae]|uniref:Membrane protein insertase YidC n=1 Tax=Vibrio stylophorae TaxID=659351 RepID=A0ABM8ZWX4_9VIBR|nr:membrane protein insertase YidC [Vibrio stylophorae]CAH0534776.1 Membrane protein insertase YidC [Vibrio stylophorae]